jgi:hypothetical protein
VRQGLSLPLWPNGLGQKRCCVYFLALNLDNLAWRLPVFHPPARYFIGRFRTAIHQHAEVRLPPARRSAASAKPQKCGFRQPAEVRLPPARRSAATACPQKQGQQRFFPRSGTRLPWLFFGGCRCAFPCWPGPPPAGYTDESDNPDILLPGRDRQIKASKTTANEPVQTDSKRA